MYCKNCGHEMESNFCVNCGMTDTGEPSNQPQQNDFSNANVNVPVNQYYGNL